MFKISSTLAAMAVTIARFFFGADVSLRNLLVPEGKAIECKTLSSYSRSVFLTLTISKALTCS